MGPDLDPQQGNGTLSPTSGMGCDRPPGAVLGGLTCAMGTCRGGCSSFGVAFPVPAVAVSPWGHLVQKKLLTRLSGDCCNIRVGKSLLKKQ